MLSTQSDFSWPAIFLLFFCWFFSFTVHECKWSHVITCEYPKDFAALFVCFFKAVNATQKDTARNYVTCWSEPESWTKLWLFHKFSIISLDRRSHQTHLYIVPEFGYVVGFRSGVSNRTKHFQIKHPYSLVPGMVYLWDPRIQAEN